MNKDTAKRILLAMFTAGIMAAVKEGVDELKKIDFSVDKIAEAVEEVTE